MSIVLPVIYLRLKIKASRFNTLSCKIRYIINTADEECKMLTFDNTVRF